MIYEVFTHLCQQYELYRNFHNNVVGLKKKYWEMWLNLPQLWDKLNHALGKLIQVVKRRCNTFKTIKFLIVYYNDIFSNQ